MINEALLETLFMAINDPSQAVRTGALRLLVRLPIPNASWRRLWHWADQQLELYLHPVSGAQALVPFEELLDATMRIPVSSLRRKLYEFLQEGQPETTRQQVIWIMARAGDPDVVDLLWPIVKDPQNANCQLAAYWIAHYDRFYQLNKFLRLAGDAPDPIVRFWLSITMLRQEEFAPFINLLIEYLEDKVELPVLYGNPLYLAQQIEECGYYPESFRALLLYIQSGGQGPRPSDISAARLNKLRNQLVTQPERLNMLLPLIGALVDILEPGSREQEQEIEQPTTPAAPWDGSPAGLIATLVLEQRLDYEAMQDVLPRLSPSQKSALISAWFDALARLTMPDERSGQRPLMAGIGNAVIQLPGWFWQAFEPDLQSLFNTYLQFFPERTDLMAQLAWVISRAGLERLLEDFLPLLPLLDPDEKPALLHLLEQVALASEAEHGPVYGDGPGSSESIPIIRHFIDYASASAGRGDRPGAPPPPPGPRYVQAEVYDHSDPQSLARLERAFSAGKEHLLKVWVAELQAGAIAAPRPVDLSQLPDLPSWDLQVYFWEPNHAPQVQLGKLTLYREPLPGQPTDTCDFTFTPRPGLPDFQGRLALVYQQNVLQMLFLEGKVLADPAEAGADDQIRFQWAEVKGLGHPEALPDFDLVFYNETDPLQGAGLMFFGGKAGLKRISGLDDGIESIITMLKEAGTPEIVAQGGQTSALISLANQGSMLYDTILEQIGAENEALIRLREVKRLQLVSAVRDVLPLELVYVYPPPEPDAELCPDAQQALMTGVCTRCDGLDADSMARRICPLGFLGLRCTIERHAIQPLQQAEAILEGKDYQIRTGLTAGKKTINPLRSSLGAASGKVTNDQIKHLTQVMGDIFQGQFEYAQDNSEWKAKFKNTPTMLILLPHTLKNRGIPSLEIGNTFLWKPEIKRALKDVFGQATQAYQPVVLLIGCETADPDTPYQSFAADFSQAGAPITVLTLSPIHATRAAPITEILVKQIQVGAKSGQTFSDALLQARREAMAAGYAEALALAADGDADWVLSEEV